MIRVTKEEYRPNPLLDQYHALKGIANRVAFDVEAVRAGVAITLEYEGENHNGIHLYSYVIWTVRDYKVVSHRLLTSATSEERLKAHAQGFIENIKNNSNIC